MVGVDGFEPPALCSQSRCATRLRYTPTRPADTQVSWRTVGNAFSRLAQHRSASRNSLVNRQQIMLRPVTNTQTEPIGRPGSNLENGLYPETR